MANLEAARAFARLLSRDAYRALRGQVAVRLGEHQDAFPVFPAGVNYGF